MTRAKQQGASGVGRPILAAAAFRRPALVLKPLSRPADESVVANQKPQRQLRRLADADARRVFYFSGDRPQRLPHRLFAAGIARRPRLKRTPDARGAVFGELQPSLAQGIHLLLAPGRLHHPIRSVPGPEKQMAQFVRHSESQQYARFAVMLLGGVLNRLEVGDRKSVV